MKVIKSQKLPRKTKKLFYGTKGRRKHLSLAIIDNKKINKSIIKIFE